MTNATPTDAYRGAGRPEATYVVERLVDAFARRVGMDPAEVRRKNLHPPFAEATAIHLRAERRLGQLRAGAGPCAGAGRLRRVPRRAGRPTRERRREAARDRRVRPTSRCAASRLRTSSARCGTWPAAGTAPRSSAARSARWSFVPARRRTGRGTRPRGPRSWPTASASRPTTSRCCTATPRCRGSAWTRTGRGRSRSAARRSAARSRRSGRRRGRSPPTSSRSPRTTSSGPTARSG